MTLSRPLVLALLAFASVGSGLIVSIVGPTVPALAGRLHVGESVLGVVFTANFLTGSAATALSGRLFDRLGPRLLTPFGLLALAFGALGEGVAGSLPALILAAVVAGIGVGVTNVCVGAAAAMLYPEGRGATLNILNVSFGTGAFAAPLLAEWCLTRLHGYTPAYVVVALVLAVPVVPLLRGLKAARRGARGDQDVGSPPPAPPLRALLARVWRALFNSMKDCSMEEPFLDNGTRTTQQASRGGTPRGLKPADKSSASANHEAVDRPVLCPMLTRGTCV